MDDFDHSMHISDHDWHSFFEESEECCLLQASLACLDSSGLSDADDPDFSTQNCTPKRVYQAGEERTEHGVCSIAQCSMDADDKGGSDSVFDPGRVLKDAHGEKERWFVSVNDRTSSQLASATASVVKKKRRKQKKICKVDCTHGEKVNTCGDMDETIQVKFPEPKHSDTDTNTECETDVSTTYLEAACKGDKSEFLNVENDSEPINIRRDFNQVKRPDTIFRQEMDFESVLKQETDRIGPGYSTLNNTSQPREIKCGTCNEITNSVKDLVFVQEKDLDVRSESSKTQVTMDLTCPQDSHEDHLDTSNSTKVHNSTCVDIAKQENSVMGLEDCGNEGHLQNILIKTSKIDISGNFDVRNQTSNFDTGAIHKDHSKINSLGCFGAPCKDGSLDLTLDTTAEAGADSSRPIDKPNTSTNSVESDEFADYESFSSCSYDSETYHSAAESVEDSRHFKQYESHIEGAHIFLPVSPSTDITPNDKSTCIIGTESSALCMSIASPTSADNSTTSLADHSESSLPTLDVTMESPEAYAKAKGSSQPVYAISAFWDEMEKLTINDILQIRMGRCMLPIEEAVTVNGISTHNNNASTEIVNSVNLPQSGTLDTLDAADSDYCTNLDESKPDRSSCDFSTSDFEDEYWQFINSSRNSSPDQHDESYQSECTDYVCEGEESDDIGTPVPSEDCSEDKCPCDSTFNLYDLAMPQQMRKNKSMYDIHAPKTMEDLYAQSFFDLSSCKSLEEPLKLSDSFEVVAPIMCLTDEQYQISFPKVFEYLFDDNKAACEAMSVSVYGLQGNLSPFNDYTFSTATNDLPVMPYIEEPIPIFSCSRPTVRELTFPKPGCIFLGTSFATMKDVSPIQIVSQSILRRMGFKQTDRSFTFSQDLSSLYAVKKISFLDKASDVWRYESEDEEKPVCAIDSNVAIVNEGGVLALTPKMFKDAALGQISMERNQMPSDDQSIFSKIKQSDMCLVCIAFASWVLRSSDPEAADAWKAALLANVSALSAIQYLRQYMKKKNSALDDG